LYLAWCEERFSAMSAGSVLLHIIKRLIKIFLKKIKITTLLFASRVTEIELPSSRSLIEERQSREQC